MANNNDVAKLNEYNLGCLEGMSYAKQGKMLEDILPKVGTKERANGIKAGFAKYLSEASADTDGSMNPDNADGVDDFGAESDLPPMEGTDDNFEDDDMGFDESPTLDSLYKARKYLGKKVIDNRWLKATAMLFIHSNKKIQDAVFIQMNGQQSLEYWLNRLLADEFIAWYQYFISANFLVGESRPDVQKFFLESAADELSDHAVKLLNRIHDLGFSDSWLSGSPSAWDEYASAKYVKVLQGVPQALATMITSEMNAIQAYNEACVVAEQMQDRVTLDILKDILADEEQHLGTLQHFVKDFNC